MDKDQKLAIAEMLTAAWQLLNGQSLEPATLKIAGRTIEPFGFDVIKTVIEQAILTGRRISIGDLVDSAKALTGAGYPSPEKALAIALDAQDEFKTVRVLPEIMEAWESVKSLNDGKHTFDHSKAFKDAYSLLVRRAEAQNKYPAWYISLGHEPSALRLDRLEKIAADDCIGIESKQEVVALIGQIRDENKPIGVDALPYIESIKAMLGAGVGDNQKQRMEAERKAEADRQIRALACMEAERENWPDPFDQPVEYAKAMRAAGRAIPLCLAAEMEQAAQVAERRDVWEVPA